MISLIFYNKGLTVIQILVIIISFINLCENSTIDYDLLTIQDVRDYNEYYFRMFSRYNQSKLDPEKAYKSIYSRTFRALPNPYELNYEKYKEYYIESEKTIDPEVIQEQIAYFNERENTSDHNDERYMKANADIYTPTNSIYYQTNILQKEYEIAKDYYDTLPTNETQDKIIPQPLSAEEFNEIMAYYELLPKYYEDGNNFFKARVNLGRLIGQHFMDLKISGAKKKAVELKDTSYGTAVVDLSVKDVHIKKESYSQYSLRLMYLGKVPLHPDILNELYGTTHKIESDHKYTGLKMDYIHE